MQLGWTKLGNHLCKTMTNMWGKFWENKEQKENRIYGEEEGETSGKESRREGDENFDEKLKEKQ